MFRNNNRNTNRTNGYYEPNYLTIQGNVANRKPIQVYRSRNNKPFAFITIGNHAGARTTYVECQAWGQQALDLTQFTKGNKVKLRAHLTNGYDTTQHGDRVRTIVPVIQSIHRKIFAKQLSQGQQGNPYPQSNGNRPYPNGSYPQNNGNYPQANSRRPQNHGNPYGNPNRAKDPFSKPKTTPQDSKNRMPSDLTGGSMPKQHHNPLKNAPYQTSDKAKSNAPADSGEPMTDDDFSKLTGGKPNQNK